MLIDAHIHLQDIQEPEVCEGILKRAAKEGLGAFYCNGIRPEDWTRIEAMASEHERIAPFFGVHPWCADKVEDGWDKRLEEFLIRHSNAGVGEIGLDGVRDVDFEKQKDIFRRQLEIAKRLKRPIAVHGIRAWGDLIAILREHEPHELHWMIHSFRGSREVLREVLGLGANISFSWKWLRDQKQDTIELICQVPLERLLLETDFPYIKPEAIRTDLGVQKYFQCLHQTYVLAVRARGITAGQLEKAVWQNGQAFLHRTSAR